MSSTIPRPIYPACTLQSQDYESARLEMGLVAPLSSLLFLLLGILFLLFPFVLFSMLVVLFVSSSLLLVLSSSHLLFSSPSTLLLFSSFLLCFPALLFFSDHFELGIGPSYHHTMSLLPPITKHFKWERGDTRHWAHDRDHVA